jgi:flavodoxin I
MKSLVVYASQSGNTKKLADAVYETLPGDKQICPLADVPDSLAEFDFIAVGFWFQGGKPDMETSQFLPKLARKKIFLFATHGAAKGSPHAQQGMATAKEMAAGADVTGTFSCQGEVNPKVLETAAAKAQPPAWFPDGPSAKGHPDSNDVAELRQLLAGILSAGD